MVARNIEVRQVGGPVLRLVVSEPLEIGRECDGLLLRDSKTSRRHALLTPHRNGVVVEDMQSSNGTWVNGQRITAPTLVTAADTVIVGETELVLWTDRPMPPPPDVVTPIDPGSSISQVLLALTPADLAPPPPPSHAFEGTVTILFSDIENSTDLVNRVGDRDWLQLLKEHNRIVRRCIVSHGGTEIKTIGDGFMVTFPSASSGLAGAIELQRSIAERASESVWPIRVRLGLHAGEVLRDGGDVFGAHVNVAARVAAHAQGAEILVSGLFHDLVRPVTNVRFTPPRELELKGFAGSHRVHAVEWHEQAESPWSLVVG